MKKLTQNSVQTSRFDGIFFWHLVDYIYTIFHWIIKFNSLRHISFISINFEYRMKEVNNRTFLFLFPCYEVRVILLCLRILLEYNFSFMSLKDLSTFFFACFTMSATLSSLFLKVLGSFSNVKILSVVMFLPILWNVSSILLSILLCF